jgi:D-alanyl-D-alanine carboxypeptidase/D-alanyl-D-alanine-endopeptidase (penicillin-binding protein 4)
MRAPLYAVTLITLFATILPPLTMAAKPRIFGPGGPPVQRSVLFQRVYDGKVLYANDAAQTLIPASVSKLLIAAAALDYYTPQGTFETHFYHSGKRRNGTIDGDLIVVGNGDPLIINEKLWQLAADFRHMGIKTITGDVVIDNSLFAGASRDASRRAGKNRSAHAYDAPVTAFGVNFNTFPVVTAPGNQQGDPARIGIDPYPINGIRLQNKLTTGRRSHIRVTRQTKSKYTLIQVRGQIAPHSDLKKFYRSVGDPTAIAGETLRAFLLQEGIAVKGGVRAGELPAKADLLYKLESYPLAKMVHGLNKFSNNYIADVLTKKMGANFLSNKARETLTPGSLAAGGYVVSEFLRKKVGLSADFSLYNGSGLDPRNRLSANHLVQLLQYIARRMDLFPEFLASLPAAGQDGTLADRFHDGQLEALNGVVRAKTGTLTQPLSAASLAGFVQHPKHGLVAFAILENGVNGKPQPNILELRQQQELALLRLWHRWQ